MAGSQKLYKSKTSLSVYIVSIFQQILDDAVISAEISASSARVAVAYRDGISKSPESMQERPTKFRAAVLADVADRCIRYFVVL